jgi:hypothetical protein
MDRLHLAWVVAWPLSLEGSIADGDDMATDSISFSPPIQVL